MDARQQIGDALAGAARTETGIIIPPHVAQQLAADKQVDAEVAAAPKPNRAQRRQMRKYMPRSERMKTRTLDPDAAQVLSALSELPAGEALEIVEHALAEQQEGAGG